MTKLFFDAEKLKRVLDHTLAQSSNQSPLAYTDLPVKHTAVLLVKDRGIYIMSNGMERDIQAYPNSYVVYAEGFNPTTDKEWYDAARDAVGGDDFIETLEWAASMKRMIDEGAKKIIVTVSRTQMSLDCEH